MRFIDKILNYSSSKPHVIKSVCHEKQFLHVVERERQRTHRSGNPFSLLIFEPINGSCKLSAYEKLSKLLKKQLRSTDEIGWYNEKSLGVFLPDTNKAGATVLKQKLLPQIDQKVFSVFIQSYPGFDNSDKSSGNMYRNCSSSDEFPERNPNFPVFNCIDEKFVSACPAWKRSVDIIGALLILVVSLPLCVVIGVYIKIVSPGPVFFKQERLGAHKKFFNIWKFRTMHDEAEPQCHMEYLKNLIKNDTKAMAKLDRTDHRIIPLGKFIRASGLDELPQLINVIRGEMSLVGPRPCLSYEAEEYAAWQHKRFDCRPGLTGLWQVSGKNRTSFIEMMRLDIRYGKHLSIVNDMLVMLKTFRAVCTQVSDQFSNKKYKEGQP